MIEGITSKVAKLIPLGLFLISALAEPVSFSSATGLQAYLDSLPPFSRVELTGRCRGRLRITKPVHLVGKGAVLDGQGKGDVVVVESSASGTIIEGFTIKNSGRSLYFYHSGIKVDGASRVVIRKNRFENILTAIYLKKAKDCVVEDNVSEGLAASSEWIERCGDGIRLYASKNIKVINNRMSNHRNGLYVEHSHNCRIERNYITGSVSQALYIELAFNNVFDGNVFEDNSTGALVLIARGSVFRNNVFRHHRTHFGYGLLIRETSGVLVEGNLFHENTKGLFMDIADRCTIRNNTFVANGWAIDLFSSCKNNVFYNNLFMASVFDVSGNVKETSNYFFHPTRCRGNYWDSYRGYDLDGDGIGDVPHRPVSFFARLAKRYPDMTIFSLSPVAEAIDFAEKLLPVFSGEGFLDRYPLVKPPFRPPFSRKGNLLHSLFLALFALALPLAFVVYYSRY